MIILTFIILWLFLGLLGSLAMGYDICDKFSKVTVMDLIFILALSLGGVMTLIIGLPSFIATKYRVGLDTVIFRRKTS